LSNKFIEVMHPTLSTLYLCFDGLKLYKTNVFDLYMYFISVTIPNRQTELRQSLEKYHL